MAGENFPKGSDRVEALTAAVERALLHRARSGSKRDLTLSLPTLLRRFSSQLHNFAPLPQIVLPLPASGLTRANNLRPSSAFVPCSLTTNRHIDLHFFGRFDDTMGNPLAANNPTEDVDEDAA